MQNLPGILIFKHDLCSKLIFISVLPPDAFIGMNELESLDLEHCGLRSIVLNDAASPNLENIFLEGNPLDCDCHARWLWNLSRASNNSNNSNSSSPNSRHFKTLKLPVCSTPFSVKNLKLESLEGKHIQLIKN